MNALQEELLLQSQLKRLNSGTYTDKNISVDGNWGLVHPRKVTTIGVDSTPIETFRGCKLAQWHHFSSHVKPIQAVSSTDEESKNVANEKVIRCGFYIDGSYSFLYSTEIQIVPREHLYR